MNNLLKELKKIQYLSGVDLEHKVEEILKKNNIDFLYQPNGTQRYPDFRLPVLKLDLECKSSVGDKPMWNCTYPKQKTLYVISSKKLKSTMVMYGSDIISQEVSEIYEEYSSKHKLLEKEINEKLSKIENNKYGMKIFARNMFVQSIGFSRELEKHTENYKTKNLGQYFTESIEIQDKLVDGLHIDKKMKILEPSCGIGHLINLVYGKAEIHGYDIDLDLVRSCRELFPDVKYKCCDFLEENIDERYDFIIANPPYFEKQKIEISDYYQEICSGRINIYYLFLYKCINLLKEDGELRFVIPRSFLSNLYALKTREFLLKHCNVLGIDFFKSDKHFKNASQNVVVLKCKKSKKYISKHEIYLNNKLFLVEDSSKVPLSGVTISSLGCSVYTGNIIWNKNKDFLSDNPKDLKLYYSSNLLEKESKNLEKKGYMLQNNNNEKFIVNGPCILVQRIFSENIVCKFIERDTSNFFVENHINIITGPLESLKTIYCSFKKPETKTFINLVFHSTQISKSELENIIQIYV